MGRDAVSQLPRYLPNSPSGPDVFHTRMEHRTYAISAQMGTVLLTTTQIHQQTRLLTSRSIDLACPFQLAQISAYLTLGNAVLSMRTSSENPPANPKRIEIPAVLNISCVPAETSIGMTPHCTEPHASFLLLYNICSPRLVHLRSIQPISVSHHTYLSLIAAINYCISSEVWKVGGINIDSIFAFLRGSTV